MQLSSPEQTARKSDLRRRMMVARAATLRLMELVPDEFLHVRVHDFYSPVGWHFGHIGMTEEHWTRCEALGMPPRDEHLSFLFANLPENPKDNRVKIPDRAGILEYMAATRAAALDDLEHTDLDRSEPLIHDGYAWEFALQHEYQHNETIIEMLQLIHQKRSDGSHSLDPPDSARGSISSMISVAGGSFVMGSDDPFGYDNEKREHEVRVESFEFDARPVTAAQWVEFMHDGGYVRRELWSEAGWAWRERENAIRPEYWGMLDDDTYVYFSHLGPRSIVPHECVSSISWFEADAYARWAGKRLPTEAEWEYAARGFGTSLFHQEADGESLGVRRVWVWTSSPFLPYPGFEAFPYEGYSKAHMDYNHMVCRGGSWATSPAIRRPSFRNWYVPTYRQGILGVRCAR